jgi:rhamnosyltransferase
MNNDLFSKTAAIIVLYDPNIELLLKSLNLIIDQVDRVILIDNSSTKFDTTLFSYTSKIDYYFLNSNYGIAYAQNFAFEIAIKEGMEFAILLDQDSTPTRDLVNTLTREMSDASVIAAGSIYHDSRSDTFSYFVTEEHGIPGKWLLIDPPPFSSIEVAHLISSGTMIKLAYLPEVGGMKTNYFIDLVDTEWSFRARSNGYKIIGVPNARLEHTLGDEVHSIWFFGRRQISYHSPLRDYYIYRNSLLMLQEKSISLRWKLHFLWRLLQRLVYFVTIAPDRLERLNKIFLGIKHGMKNTSGKLIDQSAYKLPLTELEPS